MRSLSNESVYLVCLPGLLTSSHDRWVSSTVHIAVLCKGHLDFWGVTGVAMHISGKLMQGTIRGAAEDPCPEVLRTHDTAC